jgi:hypothetical protein
MRQINFPNWLLWIDKNLKWLSIPKLPLLLIIIQVLGFCLVMGKPVFEEQLIIDPKAVFHGDIWRIFTFMAIPLANNFLVFFVLWLFYDIMVLLERAWGSNLLTVYFLFAWFSTVLASLLIGVPIKTFVYIECSFFFALATVNPNKTINLFFILPVTLKWISILTALVLAIVPLLLGSYQQIYMISFLNYALFFGKDYWLRLKSELDRRRKVKN